MLAKVWHQVLSEPAPAPARSALALVGAHEAIEQRIVRLLNVSLDARAVDAPKRTVRRGAAVLAGLVFASSLVALALVVLGCVAAVVPLKLI